MAGGRRVTVYRRGRDESLGTAYSDHDLVVFLEALGIPDPDGVLNDPKWLEWRDAAQTACGPPRPRDADPVPHEVTVRVPHHPHRLRRVIERGDRREREQQL
ncbi:hypothetical protein OIE78_35565 (plasmid) [Streptomyces cellulosae]|uniref:Uncharacterized protein n=1 Tax=Streptomyces mexicanus TaxID=178566 RepID=A0A7X1I2E4_9ACTN|nr:MULTISPECIES: hypothetical protein [Streptomyces]MBC2867467.1 hypothetical protein [Streptomyces mexicanus]WTB86748.1 hypothetical protein OG837_34655 [Streptomyces cellulosae]